VVNDELEKAVEDLKSVISAEEHKAGYAEEFINEVLKNA
jgi:guanylate kinase